MRQVETEMVLHGKCGRYQVSNQLRLFRTVTQISLSNIYTDYTYFSDTVSKYGSLYQAKEEH